MRNSVPTAAAGEQCFGLALPDKVKQAVSASGIWKCFLLQGRLTEGVPDFPFSGWLPVNF